MTVLSTGHEEITVLLQATENPIIVRKVPAGPSFASIVGLFRKQIQRGKYRSFSELLESCHIHQATDPRDKVYAVLGLAKPTTRQSIKIDYLKPVWKVYLEAAHYLMKQNEFHEVFELAGIGFSQSKRQPSLPSWVPDLSDLRDAPP